MALDAFRGLARCPGAPVAPKPPGRASLRLGPDRLDGRCRDRRLSPGNVPAHGRLPVPPTPPRWPGSESRTIKSGFWIADTAPGPLNDQYDRPGSVTLVADAIIKDLREDGIFLQKFPSGRSAP